VPDALEGKLCALECVNGNIQVQWHNIKKCVLDTVSGLIWKVESRAKKRWFTKKVINKWMNEGSRRMSTMKNEGRTTKE
jgi:hypothetical protein